MSERNKNNTIEMNMRVTPRFKEGLKKIAEREKVSQTEVVTTSVKEHLDNVWGTLRLLKILIPNPYPEPIVLEEE
jgi:hypothetical protein